MDINTYKKIVKFCSEECKRQRSGELSVSDMFNAWMWTMGTCRDAVEKNDVVSVAAILKIGQIVEPKVNLRGFRRCAVMIGGHIKKPQDFDRALEHLCSSAIVSDPVEFFRQFEMIHPFEDGNGRTGVILYNAMLNTLEDPQDPPDLRDPNFYRGA